MPRKTGIRNERFARWIARARRDARLTQEDLAERLDVSQGAITNWEREGIETMTPAMIRKVAHVLAVAPVEVAQALGYPVAEPPKARIAALEEAEGQADADPVFIATEIARLSSLLAELLEDEDAVDRATRAHS